MIVPKLPGAELGQLGTHPFPLHFGHVPAKIHRLCRPAGHLFDIAERTAAQFRQLFVEAVKGIQAR
ncbi:hypothetical protein [Fodinicola feengrottensis]|uniref:hypothetical protein n=1 Tax=Fodinicola feengrottensis TaxID=435914 RepID=UPI0013D742B6|nr:hypothetical protein [Fodinicola feengrottensis]